MRSWQYPMCLICILALSGGRFSLAAECQVAPCTLPAPCAGVTSGPPCPTCVPPKVTVQICPAPKAESSCWPLGHHHAPAAAPPYGILVQSMPVLYPQLSYTRCRPTCCRTPSARRRR
jgi:hypothetical protein